MTRPSNIDDDIHNNLSVPSTSTAESTKYWSGVCLSVCLSVLFFQKLMRPLWCTHQVTHQGMHQRYTLLVVYNWTQKRSFGQESFQTIITAYLWSMEMEMGAINSIKALKELIQQQLQLQWCNHNLLRVRLFSIVLNNLRRHERQRAAKALRA